jgi:hypothetical protein
MAAHRRARKPLLRDSGRGRPMIQVTGTAFAVLLAFVILAAFQTYNGVRTSAASEGQAALGMARTAGLFPPTQRDRLHSDPCSGSSTYTRHASRSPSRSCSTWRATRTAGRQQRLNDASPTVPTPLWLALIFGGFMTVVLQIGMLDPRERLRIHGAMVAAVAGVVAAGLVVVYYLDHPYHRHVGSIAPGAIHRTLTSVQNLDPTLRPACSATGQPT